MASSTQDILDDDEYVFKTKSIVKDPQLKSFSKRYKTWSGMVRLGNVDDVTSTTPHLLEDLTSFKSSLLRHQFIHKMHDRERESITLAEQQLSKAIESSTNEIESLKTRLSEAQLERKRKLEYDTIAKEILKLPDRKLLHQVMKQHERQLEKLEFQRTRLDGTLEGLKKQFQTVLVALQDFRHVVGEEKDGLDNLDQEFEEEWERRKREKGMQEDEEDEEEEEEAEAEDVDDDNASRNNEEDDGLDINPAGIEEEEPKANVEIAKATTTSSAADELPDNAAETTSNWEETNANSTENSSEAGVTETTNSPILTENQDSMDTS